MQELVTSVLGTQIGLLCVSWGWATMVLGILSGSALGMFAFAGPFPPPKGWEDYTSLTRRMVRLAHIAFVALPIICILYGNHIDAAALSQDMKILGSRLMIFGMIGVPVLLILAGAFWLPFKYLEVLPVSAVLVALCIMAYGYSAHLF